MSYVLHQGGSSSSASLKQQEDSEDHYPEDHNEFQETRRSMGHVIQQGGQQMRTSSVVQRTEMALLKRRAALRKLQMEKMIGSGDLPSSSSSSMNFHPVQIKHDSNWQADDSRLDRQNDAMNMNVASKRPRSSNYTVKETVDLLKIWASPEMRWQMKHNFRNFRVWEAISDSMHEMGHDRTAVQCKNRIQSLTYIFYQIKKSKQDRRTFNFPYYELMSEVLDGKKDGTTATAMPCPIEVSPALVKVATNFSGVNGNGIMNHSHRNSSSSDPGTMTAHTSLVEEYPDLINGNPETNITSFTDHNSSNSSNGSCNMNVLCPEVSLTEGNSPIRVEAQGPWSGSRSSATKPRANGVAAMSSLNRNDGIFATCAGGSMNSEPEDKVTITVEEGSLISEDEQDIEASDYDDSCLAVGHESPSGRNGRLHPRAVKRSFPSSFMNPCCGKSEYGRGMLVGNAATSKRSRIASTAASASMTMDDDPIGQYLVEMVDIGRQWLEMERERADNERAMMMYMMQILQATVCPNKCQNDNADGEEEGSEAENQGEENEFAETEQDAEDYEIRQMSEQEENQPPNGEPDSDDE